MKKLILSIAIGLVGMTTNAQTTPYYVPTNGLVGWWPFNGNANDESGNGNHGVVNGATLTNDRFGLPNKAYSFDGLDDLITFNNNLNFNITGDITISCWVVYNEIFQQQQLIWFGDNQYAQDPYSIAINPNNGFYFRKDVLSGGSINQVNHQPTHNPNYFHIVAVYSSVDSTMKMYVNGLLVDSLTTNCDINYSTNNMFLNFGGVDNGVGPYPQFLLGNLDDIGIWDRALNNDEIVRLYYISDIGTSVGIHDVKSETFFTYPNPAQINFNVKVPQDLIGLEYRLYDNLGRLVLSDKVYGEVVTIDLSNQPKGVYLFSLGGESVMVQH
jgi:hypothetical protein